MGIVLLNMTVSLDGFNAGPNVSVDRPMGEGGERLHEWLFQDGSDREVAAAGTAPRGVDVEQAQGLAADTGAVLIGRRTFDIGVGQWNDTPFPVPTFVVTHEAREPMVMKSAAFTFVSDGLPSALAQARMAAGDKDVLVMGGADIAQQYVEAGLVDEIQLQLVPVLLGGGTRLFGDRGTGHIELERTSVISSPYVTHLRFRVVK